MCNVPINVQSITIVVINVAWRWSSPFWFSTLAQQFIMQLTCQANAR